MDFLRAPASGLFAAAEANCSCLWWTLRKQESCLRQDLRFFSHLAGATPNRAASSIARDTARAGPPAGWACIHLLDLERAPRLGQSGVDYELRQFVLTHPTTKWGMVTHRFQVCLEGHRHCREASKSAGSRNPNQTTCLIYPATFPTLAARANLVGRHQAMCRSMATLVFRHEQPRQARRPR